MTPHQAWARVQIASLLVQLLIGEPSSNEDYDMWFVRRLTWR